MNKPSGPDYTTEQGKAILAARIANGWTPQEIAANQKPLGPGLVGADDDDDSSHFRPHPLTAKQLEASRLAWEVR